MSQSNYKDLTVWQRSMDLAVEVYKILNKLPKEEMYALTSQMRRAVISIPSNIAEGYGRNSNKEFIKFLHVALGSTYELETQLEFCTRVNYVTKDEISSINSDITDITKMINALINYRKQLI